VSADREQTIRERAYAIWQEEGSPLDRDLDHWLRAEAEFTADLPADVGDEGKPMTASGGNRGARSRRRI